VFVIPVAVPSAELYAGLSANGVTATLAMPWYPGDPAFDSLDAKRKAMEHFASEYL